MINLNEFFEAHQALEFLRRQNIANYWDENQEDDIIAQLNPRQLNHLVIIARYGPCSLQTIMHHTGLSSSAVSAAIDKMVKAGIVDRVQNQENRREVLVSLTLNVRNHMDRIDARFRRQISAMLADCTADEAAAINRSTTILQQKLHQPITSQKRGNIQCF